MNRKKKEKTPQIPAQNHPVPSESPTLVCSDNISHNMYVASVPAINQLFMMPILSLMTSVSSIFTPSEKLSE